MFQFFLGSNPKGLLYQDDPRNRFRPIGDLDGSGTPFTASYGSAKWNNVNDDPTNPDTNQYISVSITGSNTGVVNFTLEAFPVPIDYNFYQLTARIYAEVVSGPSDLVFNILTADVGYSSNVPFLGGPTLHEILLPSYNPEAAHTISLAVSSPSAASFNVKIYAIDVIVTPKISAAGFFFRMCGL